MVPEGEGYVLHHHRHHRSATARWCIADGAHPVVQRPICCDGAFSDKSVRLYDASMELTTPESFGAYILSDLRWGEDPPYVRDGGFAERSCVSGNGGLEA